MEWDKVVTHLERHLHIYQKGTSHRHNMAQRHNTDTIQRYNMTQCNTKTTQRQNMTAWQHSDTTWQRQQGDTTWHRDNTKTKRDRDNTETQHDTETTQRHNVTQRQNITERQQRDTMWQRQQRDTTWHRDNPETQCDRDTMTQKYKRDTPWHRNKTETQRDRDNMWHRDNTETHHDRDNTETHHNTETKQRQPAARKDCPNLLYNKAKRPQSYTFRPRLQDSQYTWLEAPVYEIGSPVYWVIWLFTDMHTAAVFQFSWKCVPSLELHISKEKLVCFRWNMV